MSGWIHGSTVVDGEVRFTSASSLEKAHSCPRAWWYQYPGKRKQPPSKSQERGTRLHEELKQYQLTGEKRMGRTALGSLHFVEPPGPGLLVDQDLLLYPHETAANRAAEVDAKAAGLRIMYRPDDLVTPAPGTAWYPHKPTIARPIVTVDGIPYLGALDAAHRRGTNRGSDDVESIYDPPGTGEVVDYKNMANDRYLKSPDELRKNIQMVSYGEYLLRIAPDLERARLSHGYCLEQGRSRKHTVLVPAEDVRKEMEHVAGVGRLIRHVAREQDPDKVDANLGACDAYGGCFHRSVCRAGEQRGLAAYVGQTAAARITGGDDSISVGMAAIFAAAAHQPLPPAQDLIPTMSLIKNISKPATAPTDTIAPGIGSPAAFKALLDQIEALGAATNLGTPALAGQAASMKAHVLGQPLAPGGGYAGTGELAAYTYSAPAELLTVLGELQKRAASIVPPTPPANPFAVTEAPPAPPVNPFAQAPVTAAPVVQQGGPDPVGILPPDAPMSDPALASVPVDGAFAQAPAAGVFGGGFPASLAPAAAPAQVEAPATATVAEPPKKRAKKADTVTVELPQTAPAPAAAPATGAINIYVNAIPSGMFRDLRPWFFAMCEDLAKSFETDARLAGAPADVRFAAEGSAISYGKWRAAVSAGARERVLEPGHYVLMSSDQLVESALEGLTRKCEESGGRLVRGLR